MFVKDFFIVCDGLLRSKVFAGEHFRTLLAGFDAAIKDQYAKRRRRIYLVGVAKHNSALARYRLAMALERILTTPYAAYVEIPRDIETKAYVRIRAGFCGRIEWKRSQQVRRRKDVLCQVWQSSERPDLAGRRF